MPRGGVGVHQTAGYTAGLPVLAAPTAAPDYCPRGKVSERSRTLRLGGGRLSGEKKVGKKEKASLILAGGERGKQMMLPQGSYFPESTAELFRVTNTMTDGDQKWKRRSRKSPRKQSKDTNIWKIKKEGLA